MQVEYTAKTVKTSDGTIKAEPPKGAMAELRKGFMELCHTKHGGYVTIKLSTPHRPRSTGAKSQNHHFNGHCQQISQLTGQPIDDVRRFIKARAVSRGYPMLRGWDGEPLLDLWGNIQGASESESSVEQCKMLIDEVHQFAAEEGIALTEGEE
jgi:hypothetical protein